MLLNYIKLIRFDIKFNLKFYIFLMLQSIVAFYVIGSISGNVYTADERKNALDGMESADNYYAHLETEIYTEHGIFVSEKYMELQMQISSYIAENFDVVGRIAPFDSNDELYGAEVVTDGFFEINGIKAQEGRLFSAEEYGTDTMENTPIIMGADLRAEYSLGDKYLGKYEIVGFLEKGSEMVIPKGENSILFNLDSDMFIPVKSLKYMSDNDIEYPTTLIYTENKSDLKKINDYVSELGLYPYNFVSLSECKTLVNNFANRTNIPLIVISSIIILLALLCLIQSMLEFVKKNIVELLIHMMCGAKLSDIILRVGAGTALTAFISAATASLVFRSTSTTAVLFITAAAVTVIAVLPVAVRLKLKPLIVAVKEEK